MVVTRPNALPHMGAMMIKIQHTIITPRAMKCALWAEDMTCVAIFHICGILPRVCRCQCCGRGRCIVVVDVNVEFDITTGQNPGVGEGRGEEGGEGQDSKDHRKDNRPGPTHLENVKTHGGDVHCCGGNN